MCMIFIFPNNCQVKFSLLQLLFLFCLPFNSCFQFVDFHRRRFYLVQHNTLPSRSTSLILICTFLCNCIGLFLPVLYLYLLSLLPLFVITLLSAHLLIVSRFGLPANGSLPNGRPPLHLGMFLTTLNFSLLLLALAGRSLHRHSHYLSPVTVSHSFLPNLSFPVFQPGFNSTLSPTLQTFYFINLHTRALWLLLFSFFLVIFI